MSESDWLEFFPSGTPVVALPNWASPRILIAADSIRGRWQRSAVFPAYRGIAKLRKILLRARACIDSSIRTAHGSWYLEEVLSRVDLQHLQPSAVIFGTPGPAQKITIQLTDENREAKAYLKFGVRQAARARLENEWRVLSHLPPNLAPRAIWHGPLANGFALLVEAVPGRPLRARLSPRRPVIEYLRRLPVERTTGDHPWLTQLWNASEMLRPTIEVLSTNPQPVVVGHGDFAPWNLVSYHAIITPIDWEYGSLKSFPGADFVYYILQVGALIRRWRPEIAARSASELVLKAGILKLSEREAFALVRLVAFDAWNKSLEDGQPSDNYLQRWRERVWKGSV